MMFTSRAHVRGSARMATTSCAGAGAADPPAASQRFAETSWQIPWRVHQANVITLPPLRDSAGRLSRESPSLLLEVDAAAHLEIHAPAGQTPPTPSCWQKGEASRLRRHAPLKPSSRAFRLKVRLYDCLNLRRAEARLFRPRRRPGWAVCPCGFEDRHGDSRNRAWLLGLRGCPEGCAPRFAPVRGARCAGRGDSVPLCCPGRPS
jgi:hypothetical protein